MLKTNLFLLAAGRGDGTGDGYLPVHAGGRVMGLAVRVLLNKLERTVLQFLQ